VGWKATSTEGKPGSVANHRASPAKKEHVGRAPKTLRRAYRSKDEGLNPKNGQKKIPASLLVDAREPKKWDR
jgi:hypothetical protein